MTPIIIVGTVASEPLFSTKFTPTIYALLILVGLHILFSYSTLLLEPIGEISVIPKAENTPVTVQHLDVSINDEGLPIAVIIDGKIQYKNLKLLGKSKDWLMEHLHSNELKEKDIIYAYINEKTKN